MATSIFDNKAQIPDSDMITEALGSAKELWDMLQEHIYGKSKDIKSEWKFYSKKSGWSLICKKKDRTLRYFVPCKEYFKVFFVFGEKAVDAAQNADSPDEMVKHILASTTYAEGTSFDIDVKRRQDLESVYKLLEIKDKM